ncbi:MAG: PQQ-like beta-propeller repeat protein [Prolixibacteraceae bacterium]|nr:PQQ-like beta-propeller repeat protein [Prolixibacteraceae bacterium]
MKNQKFIHSFFLVIIVSFIFSCTQKSGDWPGWRGENRDAKVVGFKAPAQWPTELTKKWQATVGLCDGAPSFVDGKLFLYVQQDSSEIALCLDAGTGNNIWKTVLNPAAKMQGGGAQHPGPRSTPLVDNGKVFMLGADGAFTCVNAETGEIIWQNLDYYPQFPVFYTSASPLVINNLCIIHLGGHDDGIIVAFDKSTGEKIWTIEGEPSTYSSPVIMKLNDEEIIVLQTEVDLLGISPEGKVLFRIPTPGERRFYNSTTPIVDGQNIFIVGQGLGTKMYKIEKSGDTYNFSEVWSNPDFGGSFNTPVLKDGYLYGNEAAQGKLYCLNASTGETAWADDVKYDRFALGLDLGKVLLSLPATGELVIYKPNPNKYEEIAKYKVVDPPVYAHPVVAGNKIFIKGKDDLICWSVD